ncbi:hypothetical protein ACJW30_01G249800 [Castanea mollissima]
MALNNVDSTAIDIEGLASSIKAKMSQDLFVSPNCSIFRAPTILLRLNEKAYVPNAFSIGPFHHGHPKLQAMEAIKSNYLQGLISRSPFPEEMLRNLIMSISDVEREVRECYAKPLNYSPDEFVKILVVDGRFIIELFRKDADEKLRGVDDPIFNMLSMHQFLYHDLILLENQIPWMVLEHLFNLTKDPTHDKPLTLIELAREFFADYFLTKPASGKIGKIYWTLLPSATSLVEAGVKIKRRESKGILDIKFIDGALEIPPLQIHEITETFFRSLICFEQCYPNCEPRFTSYAVLIDNLINNAKDVDVLIENKIFENWLNPADAVPFFNKLYYNAYVKEIYYQGVREEVNEYCNRRWPKWRAMLVRNYFNTPWAILSTTAATILLILSFVQTWYTIY